MHESRPSSTAFLIARALLLASREPTLRNLLPADAAALSARYLAVAGPRSRWVSSALEFRVVRKFLLSLERAVLPGLVLHFLLRKRWLEDLVRTVIADGCRQVVVLGPGLDTLAIRLHREFTSVRFIEIDHPATQRLKISVLAQAADTTLGSFVSLPADLAKVSLAAVLRQPTSGFAAGRPTLVLAEGLLMYLAPVEVERLLTAIRTDLPETTDLIFTFLKLRSDGTIGFEHTGSLVRRWLRWRGEPFHWAISESELPALLQRCGWKVKSIAQAAEFRRRYLANTALASRPLVEGEAICVAERLRAFQMELPSAD